ncbi:hypothetical protein [Halalkalibacter alkalisediminis]|uniref:Uncharacterized protein n=1 Tax=Halalkalibacter alkalisediminis TaxID=935616 RepID=A0ABV6NL93_9BACI|nr:hypothetical protein [Halalkalibacter alkalisediminis]
MKKIFSLTLVIALFVGSFASVSKASEINYQESLIEEGEFTEDFYSDDNLIEGVDYDIVSEYIPLIDTNEDKVIDITQDSSSEITPFHVVMPGPLWKTTDVKYVKEVTGTATLWKTSGEPGINIGLNYTRGTNATISQTYGASHSALSANLSFTIGKSYSVSSTGDYKVPSTHNGKKVAKAEVSGHPIYKQYSLKIHKRNDIYYRYDYKGSAYAYKPIGIHIKKKIYYK